MRCFMSLLRIHLADSCGGFIWHTSELSACRNGFDDVWSSGDEEEFAGGFTGLEVAVGLSGFCEGIGVFEAKFEGAVGDSVEDVGRA